MSLLTRLSLHLGSVVLLAIALLFAAGVLAATRIQQDLLPNISVPSFAVVTADAGASPTVVDQEVTTPIASVLQGVSGVDTVSSTSNAGSSQILVTFKDGTDVTSDRQSLSTALDNVRPLLPQSVPAPTIQAFSTSSLPILAYAVSSDEPLGDLAGQLRTTALPKLKGLAGVSSVTLTGAPTDEVTVTLDPAQLAAQGITSGQVVAALQQASLVQSVGAIRQGSTTIPVQISGSLTSLDQIAGVLVSPQTGGQPGGSAGAGNIQQAPTVGAAPQPLAAPVPIGQLGTVRQVSIPPDTVTRTNGRLSIGLRVLSAPDANTVTVANEVKDTLP